MPKFTITGVPNATVAAMVRTSKLEGATDVEVKDNGDGTSDVTPMYRSVRTYQELVAAKEDAKTAAT